MKSVKPDTAFSGDTIGIVEPIGGGVVQDFMKQTVCVVYPSVNIFMLRLEGLHREGERLIPDAYSWSKFFVAACNRRLATLRYPNVPAGVRSKGGTLTKTNSRASWA